MRALLVLVHRYVGLVLAGFLLVVGLTGSLLAWNDALEAVLAPQLFRATAVPGRQPLDPLVLRDKVAAHYPQARVRFSRLSLRPGATQIYRLAALPDPATGRTAQLPNDEVFVDPYTGVLLGERKWGDIKQGKKNLMPFIYRLHYSLALDVVGSYAFGVVALLWTLDCFVGAYLSLPPHVAKPGKPWFTRWSPAWRVRWSSGSYKLNFDLHRAGGLWLWAMLLVLAWSSVAFNLSEVYDPVMRASLSHQPTSDDLPPLARPQIQPGISWGHARATGRRLMAEQAQIHGFTLRTEDLLAYDPMHAVYRYDVQSSLDIRDHQGDTSLLLDANTGAFKGLWLPTGAAAGDTLREWITSLHMARLWGLPMQIFICLMGLAVALLSATGVVVWLKKRRGRAARRG